MTTAIDAYWAEYFGCGMEELMAPGPRVAPHAAMLADYEGAFLFRRAETCLVSVPPGWFETVQRAVRGRTPEQLFETAYLERVFAEALDRMIGPAWIGYADATDFQPRPLPSVRLLVAGDDGALARLAGGCEATAWEHSGLEIGRGPVCGCFRGEEIVAAAGYTRWGETIAHIGVVTHPGHRGHGYGKAVVSGIAEHALRERLIPQYRTLQSNAPSLGIGHALGFGHYATTLAIRLRAMNAGGDELEVEA